MVRFLHYPAAALCIAATMLAGCGGSQPLIGNSGAMLQGRAIMRPYAGQVEITEFNDLPKGPREGRPHYVPEGLVVGADGAIWVAESNSADGANPIVARVITSGKRTAKYPYGGGTTSFLGIAAGADGALWLADPYGGGGCCGTIVRMTTAGEFTKFLPTAQPYLITTGPDGALWYVQGACCHLYSFVSRITTQGSMTDFQQGMPERTIIGSITAGPDGALWFTETGWYTGVARIATDGTITQFSQNFHATSRPGSIATGPDGALWFTDSGGGAGGRIGRVTTQGTLTEYSKGISAGETPVAIAAGPDGAMWFTECTTCGANAGHARIGRITMSGKITEFSKLTQSSSPSAIIQGPDHNMWFVERATDKLARLRIIN